MSTLYLSTTQRDSEQPECRGQSWIKINRNEDFSQPPLSILSSLARDLRTGACSPSSVAEKLEMLEAGLLVQAAAQVAVKVESGAVVAARQRS